jgi:hypothetical protein
MCRKDSENELNVKNMKRESKVYSYKEQLEELQLRRELEEKRRKQGKLKEPQLTPKQKEAVRLQLEKESTIRARLTEVTMGHICLLSHHHLPRFSCSTCSGYEYNS